MDEDTATRFVSSLVKSIQALCNGYIDFSTSIEVVGHIHLNIDRNVKFDYVLTEEVCKSLNEAATVFSSHSYHSRPPPPPSATSKSTDSSGQNRRKSQVTHNDDSVGARSHPSEVPNTARSDNQSQSSNRVGESSDSSQSGNANISQDSVSSNIKHEDKTSCQVQESLDRRRKNALSHRTPSPAAKRSRNNDSSSNLPVQNPGFDVIEIKEEPDDEPTVYFGDNSSHVAAGQDIQTPDFSNVVMESLDRVGQIEGTQLVAGGDGMLQQQPFPVMLHANSGMPSSTISSSSSAVPGPSLDPRSTASASGVVFGAQAFFGTKHAGGMQPTVIPPKHPMIVDHLNSGIMKVNSRYGQWTQPCGRKQGKIDEGATESEEVERIRIRRERVRLRVQAHRARKKAAQMEAGRMLAQCTENEFNETNYGSEQI